MLTFSLRAGRRKAAEAAQIYPGARMTTPVRICFFGDSLVNGTGDDDGLGWVGRLVSRERRAGRDVTAYNLGVCRDTSADIAARWREEARRRLPEDCDARLLFSFGANDCVEEEAGRARVPLEETLAHAEQMLREAMTRAPVLMVGPFLPGAARIDGLCPRLQKLCAALRIPYIETRGFAARCGVLLQEAAAGDGAHPNSGGYAALADFIGAAPQWRAWLDRGLTSAKDAPADR
ncbi:GDSL-type esterase/lipase family protein [Methylosinus sp. PW1]|uniref:GDSL-type esterase/lipase family protein n=1 Tax=Methylosinus sp. PW1 TaxID=107636 RepID=UPI000B0C66B9|nr:GDSL-type esterase/lipase family protein [Methylosinus sp. PW1]